MTSKTIIEVTQYETGESIFLNPNSITRMNRYKDSKYTMLIINNGPETNVVETPQEIMEMVNTDATNAIVINGKIDALDAAVKAAQKTADDALTKVAQKTADDALTKVAQKTADDALTKANVKGVALDG